MFFFWNSRTNTNRSTIIEAHHIPTSPLICSTSEHLILPNTHHPNVAFTIAQFSISPQVGIFFHPSQNTITFPCISIVLLFHCKISIKYLSIIKLLQVSARSTHIILRSQRSQRDDGSVKRSWTYLLVSFVPILPRSTNGVLRPER